MKNHRGLTRKKSILFHGLQQCAAYVAFVCAAILICYSFTSVKTNNANYANRRINYDWNLFSREESFDETSTFDYMLMDALQEIIRYNVAKSQLETDGEFDGAKVIDVRAFANRKSDLQSGMDLSAGAEGVEIAAGEQSTAGYYLEDLIKWGRYGLVYEELTLDLADFVGYFGYRNIWEGYDGNITDSQWGVLESVFGDDAVILRGRVYSELYDVYDAGMGTESDAGAAAATEQIDDAGIDAAAEQTEPDAVYYPWLLQAFADIWQENTMITMITDAYMESSGEVMVSVLVLDERYQTADGRNLLSIAESWSDYALLVQYVTQAVTDLGYNYNEYLGFKERYGQGATNIVYTFEMTMMGEPVRVSNLPVTGGANLDSYYSTSYGRYMIYRPQTMTFESNTGIIEEADLFEAFADYEYAYPDTAKIWLAVDTTYPADDQFAQAAAAYNSMHPYAYLLLGIGIAACVFWLVLFLFLSVQTGWLRQKGEEGVLTLCWFDAIPTEIVLGLGVLLAGGILILSDILLFPQSTAVGDYICGNRIRASLLMALVGTAASGLFCLFWYSLVRRIKARTLLGNSLLGRFVGGIRRMLKRGYLAIRRPVLRMYDNSNILMRCVLSTGSVMFVNFVSGFLVRSLQRRGFGTGVLLSALLFILAADMGIIYLEFRRYLKRKSIVDGIGRIRDGEVEYQVDTGGMHGENLQLAEAVNSIGEGIKTAVEISMKDERLKADLITNVSHDIKTPLTSIINYVDLLKRENIGTEPAKSYIEVLDAKSQRLKQLTDDLVEASKISSGNITLIMERINLKELIRQALGEYSEKFEEKKLQIMEKLAEEDVCIEADSRRIWRVMENLLGNICKYALPGTRVYLDLALSAGEKRAVLSIKNISAQPLNIRADELTERFIRGDVSRSTEGSGLGLSIAKNLTELQNGKFEIYLDGDLFKVTLVFPIYDGDTA